VPDPVELADGRWRVRVFIARDPVTGRQITRTHTYPAKGKKAAKVIARQYELEDKASAGARETFGQAAETWYQGWLTSKKRSPRTRKEYRRRIDYDLKATRLWGTKVDKITPGDIDRWYQHLTAQGKAPASIRTVHTIVRQTFKDLVRRRIIAHSPALEAWLPEMTTAEGRIPTFDELMALCMAGDRRDLTRGVCFLTAAGTAMRRGELTGLRWSKVDLVQRRVLVDTASVLGGQLKGTKTGKKAVVALTPLVTAALQLLRTRQETMLAKAQLDAPAEDSWFVFATKLPFDEPANEDQLTWWFKQARIDTGVTGVRLHDLRHWAVSNALAAGVAPTDVQAMSRHQSLKLMLDTYGHAVGEASERAVASLPLPEIEWGQDRALMMGADDDAV
jgi:integrase